MKHVIHDNNSCTLLLFGGDLRRGARSVSEPKWRLRVGCAIQELAA